ncbi:MAG: signal peptidase II [Spirochaetales bacterium]|nr:signal peptidase II [Spirochaetales bacterium]
MLSKQKLVPLILVPIVVIIDQVSKIIITLSLEYNQIVEVLGDFLRLWYRTNKHSAFGIGSDWPAELQFITFLILPLIVLGGALFIYFNYKELNSKYRWLLAAIIGAGVGNMIDRFLRPDGVVDFIDVNTYGILGLPVRWPTFNIADATLTVSIILFVIFFIIAEMKSRHEKPTA